MLALLQAMRGEFAEARASYVAARALFEDLGVAILAASVSLESAPVELLAGDLNAAERELRRDYEALDRMGEKYFLSTIAALLGQVLYAQDRYDEASMVAGFAREIAAEDDVLSQVLWRSVEAKLLARVGDEERALTLAREAVALARRTDSPVAQGDALLDLAEVLRLTGHAQEEAIHEAAELYELKGDVAAARAARGLARAAAARSVAET
jgi:ATP/maltotriose-dependent transcriptional regulator MalT